MKDIRQRCEAATAGPWVVLPPCGDRVPINFEIVADTGWICDGDLGDRANAEFIAHAREDIPRLLARIDELEAAGRALRDDLIARARFDDDAKTVCASRGAWEDFCAALEQEAEQDG